MQNELSCEQLFSIKKESLHFKLLSKKLEESFKFLDFKWVQVWEEE